MLYKVHDAFWDAVGVFLGDEPCLVHKAGFYDFHKKLNFTLLFADCGDYSAYLGYAYWCRHQGYYELAYEYLKIAVHDRSTFSRLEMARVCYVLGKYEEAIQYTEMFRDEEIYSYNFYQALAYRKLGQEEKCVEIMKELANSNMSDVGEKEAKAFLETSMGIKEDLDANDVFDGIHLKFTEAPKAHIIYLTISVVLWAVCLLLSKYMCMLAVIGPLPVVYYGWLVFSRLDKKNYTLDNLDSLARSRSGGVACKPRDVLRKPEHIVFYSLRKKDLYIPKESDFREDSGDPYGYKSHWDMNRETQNFLAAKTMWANDIPRIVADIRANRIKILLECYEKGENLNVIKDALKYLYDIEIVDGEIRHVERTLPFASQVDWQHIKGMHVKTRFEDKSEAEDENEQENEQ